MPHQSQHSMLCIQTPHELHTAHVQEPSVDSVSATIGEHIWHGLTATWDLSNGVGVTATGVAVGRALGSRGPNALINDPFAEPLVRAVGVDFFTHIASGELDPALVDDNGDFGMKRMAT
jgi:leucine carboxyl methyltransferase